MKKRTLNVILLSSFMTLLTSTSIAQNNNMFIPSKTVPLESSNTTHSISDTLTNDSIVEKVVYQQDDRLIELQERYNKAHESGLINGFRIELYSSSGANSRMKAYEALLDFKEKYDQIKGYVEWNEPNFEVEVGDFRTRLEAQKQLREIAEDYPFAFIKKTKIKLPDLRTEKKAED